MDPGGAELALSRSFSSIFYARPPTNGPPERI